MAGDLLWYPVEGRPGIRVASDVEDWVSPRLGIRFSSSAGELRLWHPDGQPFVTFVEMQQRAEQERQRAEQAEQALTAERTRVEELLSRLRALGQEP